MIAGGRDGGVAAEKSLEQWEGLVQRTHFC